MALDWLVTMSQCVAASAVNVVTNGSGGAPDQSTASTVPTGSLGFIVETFLRDQWREFVLLGFLSLLLAMLVRVVGYMRLVLDSKKQRKGWFEILCVGSDLTLMGVAGLFVLAKALDHQGVTQKHEPLLVSTIVMVILVLLAAISTAFSHRKSVSVVFSMDAFLAMHIPNALGVVAVFIVAALMNAPS